MTRWKLVALAVATITAAAWLGASFAPVAHGQSRPARAQRIMTGGSRIGVSVRDVDDDDVKRAKLQGVAGVLVEEVEEDSPAQKGGIRKDDVIVEFDGERVRSSRQFTRLVQETPAGRKVAAAVMRDGQRVAVNLEPRDGNGFTYFGDVSRLEDLGRAWRAVPPMPPMPPVPAVPATPRAFDFGDFFGRSTGRLGVTMSDLSPQLAEYFGTKDGVLVTSVSDNSAAAKAGLKAGDVITAVNGTNVSSPADVRRRLERLDTGEEFTLGIVRDRKAVTIKGKLEDRPRRTYSVRAVM